MYERWSLDHPKHTSFVLQAIFQFAELLDPIHSRKSLPTSVDLDLGLAGEHQVIHVDDSDAVQAARLANETHVYAAKRSKPWFLRVLFSLFSKAVP